MTAGLLASDIGVLPKPASEKPAYGDFVQGRRNAAAFSPMSPPSFPHLESAELMFCHLVVRLVSFPTNYSLL